jgi:hypothetical protein
MTYRIKMEYPHGLGSMDVEGLDKALLTIQLLKVMMPLTTFVLYFIGPDGEEFVERYYS